MGAGNRYIFYCSQRLSAPLRVKLCNFQHSWLENCCTPVNEKLQEMKLTFFHKSAKFYQKRHKLSTKPLNLIEIGCYGNAIVMKILLPRVFLLAMILRIL